MKRTTWILFFGLLGATIACTQWVRISAYESPGAAPSPEYTMDGTLEPDEIPGLARSSDFVPPVGLDVAEGEDGSFDQERTVSGPLSVDGPARLPKNMFRKAQQQDRQETEKLLAMDRERPIRPPQRIRVTSAHFEPNGKYALVQYRSSNQRRSRGAMQSAPEVRKSESMDVVQEEIGPKREPEHPESLKRSVRSTLTANSKRAITTQHNSPGDVLLMALPYGADARVWQPNSGANPRDRSEPKGSYIYSIGTLCWNYNCAGKKLLRSDGKRVFARVGAGYQRRPASFLALLAMSNIMPNYELKVDGGSYSIEHLVASEKAAVSKGMNLSMTLIGLSFYGNTQESWKNEMGEAWSLEKMIIEELNRSIDQGTSDVTDWLLGLTAAVNLYEEESRTLRGPAALAKKQIGTYQDFVLSVQNENYLWHPKFFLFKGVSPDVYETLYSSGHILRWLILSMDEDQLNDVRVRKSVANLVSTVNRIPQNVPAGSFTDRQLESLAVSLQALSVYYYRAFGTAPLEDSVPVQEEKSVARR